MTFFFLNYFNISCRVFSFEDGRFRTPWITVGDFTDMEKPLFLEFITFDFVYSGNEIVSAKWKIEC